MREPKPIRWSGTSLSDLRAFPLDARQVAGFQLRRLQLGLPPKDWKPMPSVGAGVREIRIHTGMEHREAIYVLHAFAKRTRKTATRDIRVARDRFGHVISARRQELDP